MKSTDELKSAARRIFAETLAGIDIARTLERKLAFDGARICCDGCEFDLAQYSRIRVVALGKAALPMARAVDALLSPRFELRGIVVAPFSVDRPSFADEPALAGSSATAGKPSFPAPDRYEVFLAGHPTPTEESFAAARAILKMLAACDAKTLVLFLISGGGSSLAELPLDGAISLADVQTLNKLLVECGAPIDEINCVRKHLSAVKGGRLALAAGGATKITLGITDVPEGRESALASGPTLPDPSTVADAQRVIQERGLLAKLPAAIQEKFVRADALTETPKADDPVFRNAHFEIVLGMNDLFHHAHVAAEASGFIAVCDNVTDDWPLARAAEYLLGQLARLREENPGRCVAVIADGELSSPVLGNGVGGRNSAFVLECLARISERSIAVLSAGTDGVDGSSPAAGAVADGETLARALEKGIDPNDFAQRSDTFHFFEALGDAVITGPTGNNLRDLRVLLAGPE
jgi:glycerate 2-kinase